MSNEFELFKGTNFSEDDEVFFLETFLDFLHCFKSPHGGLEQHNGIIYYK